MKRIDICYPVTGNPSDNPTRRWNSREINEVRSLNVPNNVTTIDHLLRLFDGYYNEAREAMIIDGTPIITSFNPLGIDTLLENNGVYYMTPSLPIGKPLTYAIRTYL